VKSLKIQKIKLNHKLDKLNNEVSMGMQKDLILKRDGGVRIKIIVTLSYYRGPEYNWEVFICLQNKRTFKPAVDTDNHIYRVLGMEERVNYIKNESLKFVTEDELLEAKKNLWNLLDPELFGL
jgi:hypothetical protein